MSVFLGGIENRAFISLDVKNNYCHLAFVLLSLFFFLTHLLAQALRLAKLFEKNLPVFLAHLYEYTGRTVALASVLAVGVGALAKY